MNLKLIKVNTIYKSFSKQIIKNIFIDDCMQKILSIVFEKDAFTFFKNIFKDKSLQIDITITNNKYITLLNKKWMNKNTPTDVLSFPLHQFHNNQINEFNEFNELFLGDIIISYEYLINYCSFNKINKHKHFLRLLSHGFLHLLGFDHSNQDDAKEMFNLENIILKPLIKGSGLTINFFQSQIKEY